jgi:G3E family GTPase
MPDVEKVPLVVICGALGSGKTTLLSRLVQRCIGDGRRIGLIVNDYAALGVDSLILREAAGADVPMRDISGSCICCSGGDDLAAAVYDLASTVRVELVLIEATGVADAVELLDNLSSPILRPVAEVGRVVTVVDAGTYGQGRRDNPLLRWQVALADVVVLNKLDLVAEDLHETLSRIVRGDNPSAPLLAASFGDVDLETVLALTEERTLNPSLDALPPSRGHAEHQTLSIELPDVLDAERFEQLLGALPPGVLRAKGFVALNRDPVLHLFNLASGGFHVAPFMTPKTYGLVTLKTPNPYAVFIGTAFDDAALRSSLQACVADSTEVPS